MAKPGNTEKKSVLRGSSFRFFFKKKGQRWYIQEKNIEPSPGHEKRRPETHWIGAQLWIASKIIDWVTILLIFTFFGDPFRWKISRGKARQRHIQRLGHGPSGSFGLRIGRNNVQSSFALFEVNSFLSVPSVVCFFVSDNSSSPKIPTSTSSYLWVNKPRWILIG